MYVLLETHPNTLTDTLPSTIELLEEVNHPNLKINLDFLHIWESGAYPIDSFHRLKPWTLHYHFKNISSADYLHVFEPNMYISLRQEVILVWFRYLKVL